MGNTAQFKQVLKESAAAELAQAIEDVRVFAVAAQKQINIEIICRRHFSMQEEETLKLAIKEKLNAFASVNITITYAD